MDCYAPQGGGSQWQKPYCLMDCHGDRSPRNDGREKNDGKKDRMAGEAERQGDNGEREMEKGE